MPLTNEDVKRMLADEGGPIVLCFDDEASVYLVAAILGPGCFDPEDYPERKVGDVQYQISNGLPGARSESWNTHDLDDARRLYHEAITTRAFARPKPVAPPIAQTTLAPLASLDLEHLRGEIYAVGVANLPDAGDYHSFSETAEADLDDLLVDLGLWGCHIDWDSDGEHNTGILVITPDNTAHPVSDPFQTDEEPWSVTPEAVEAMLHDLLNLRAKYGPALEAARAAFLTVLGA